jgi:uncharacterized damage-inducible protein DinB
MKQSEYLANRIREVILNGTWIANTNYKDQLESLDWREAIKKRGTINSISLIAQHIHYYIHGIMEVFKGGPLEIKDKFSFDFPPIKSELEWQEFLTRFWNDTEQLAELIENLPEEMLIMNFVEEKYGTYQRNIEGMIEHCYYHLGQIVLSKKL